jgi:hypothetical protein
VERELLWHRRAGRLDPLGDGFEEGERREHFVRRVYNTATLPLLCATRSTEAKVDADTDARNDAGQEVGRSGELAGRHRQQSGERRWGPTNR